MLSFLGVLLCLTWVYSNHFKSLIHVVETDLIKWDHEETSESPWKMQLQGKLFWHKNVLLKSMHRDSSRSSQKICPMKKLSLYFKDLIALKFFISFSHKRVLFEIPLCSWWIHLTCHTSQWHKNLPKHGGKLCCLRALKLPLCLKVSGTQNCSFAAAQQ